MTALRNTAMLWAALALEKFQLAKNFEREEGQTLAEYALILALIAVGVVIVVLTLGHTIRDLFSNAASSI
jgi:Flp pilus assembly pilin Flp